LEEPFSLEITMILTVAQYRAMAQEADTVHTNGQITLALARYTAFIEGFTGRRFQSGSLTENFYNCDNGPLQLRDYPVTEITSIKNNGSSVSTDGFDIHKTAGLIYHYGFLRGLDIVVEYIGGYDEAPYEVKSALMTLTSAYLNGDYGGVETLTAGRKEVVMGVGSIDYGNTAQQLELFGTPYAELGPFVSILEKYREPTLA
jgi:hypothetical protein